MVRLETQLHAVRRPTCPQFAWDCPGLGTSQVVQLVNNLPASAGDAGDTGSILGLGKSVEEEMATYSNILAWEIPWVEEPCGLQSMGSQRVRRD